MLKITVSSSHIIFKIFPSIPTHHNFNIALTSFSQVSSRRIPSLEIPPQLELTSPLSRFVKLVADVNVLSGALLREQLSPFNPSFFSEVPRHVVSVPFYQCDESALVALCIRNKLKVGRGCVSYLVTTEWN